MGGLGSGLYGGSNIGKKAVESCRSIDIRKWQKMKLLEGKRFGWEWRNQFGEKTGSVSVMTLDDRLILFYNYQGEEKAVRIYYDETKTGYGSRKWFLCPGCDKRKAILYFDEGQPACRGCHKLNYASSQAADDLEYYHLQLQKLCKRLGAAYDPMAEFAPEKPKGMHWKAYAKIWQRYMVLAEKRREAFIQGAGAILRMKIE